MTVCPSRALLLAVHDEQLARYGGTPGLIDSSRLDHILERFASRANAGVVDLQALAAGCALDILRERPFLDGNVRTAFITLSTTLALNGVGFEAPEVEATLTLLAVASGEIDDDAFIAWVRGRCEQTQRAAMLRTNAG